MKEPNQYHLLYLWFKALFFSSNYQLLCENNTNLLDLQPIYPNINDTFELWGNIFISEDVDVAFGLWVEQNHPKINQEEFFDYRVVRAGELMKPNYGFVYYTVSVDADIEEIANTYKKAFQESLKCLQDEITSESMVSSRLTTINGCYFPFTNTGFNKQDKIKSNARRVEAYVAFRERNLEPQDVSLKDTADIMKKTFRVGIKEDSEPFHLDDVTQGITADIWKTTKQRLAGKYLSLDDYNNPDVKAEITEFKKSARQGKNLVAHATNNQFPKCTAYKVK